MLAACVLRGACHIFKRAECRGASRLFLEIFRQNGIRLKCSGRGRQWPSKLHIKPRLWQGRRGLNASLIPADTPSLPFNARETVEGVTPHSLAISTILTKIFYRKLTQKIHFYQNNTFSIQKF